MEQINTKQGYKICSRCKKEKSIKECFRTKLSPTGKSVIIAMCIPCINENKSEWTNKRRAPDTSLVNPIEGEEWRLIDGFENYFISNLGRVKSIPRKTRTTEMLLTFHLNNKGRYYTILRNKKGSKSH